MLSSQTQPLWGWGSWLSPRPTRSVSSVRSGSGTVKLTDLKTYSELCPLPKLLISHAGDDRIRLQNPRILFNLTVPYYMIT